MKNQFNINFKYLSFVLCFSSLTLLNPLVSLSQSDDLVNENENLLLTEKWLEAYNTKNWDQMSDLMADSLHGFIRFEKNIYKPSFPDSHSKKKAIYAEGDMVFLVGEETATNSDSLRWMVESPIPATNVKYNHTWFGAFKWEKGKIVWFRFHIDGKNIRRQLGLTKED